MGKKKKVLPLADTMITDEIFIISIFLKSREGVVFFTSCLFER